MSAIMEILIKAVDEASGVLDGVGANAEGVASGVELGFLAASAAIATVGAGLEGFARGRQDTEFALQRMSQRTGESAGSLREWAASMIGPQDSLDDMVALMDLASKRGIEGKDNLMAYAQFWDNVGDATGENALKLAEAGVGLQSVGVAAGKEGQALGAFGFIADNTTMSVSDFLGFIQKTGPQLTDMGLSVDDSAAVLGLLETKFGLTGRAARTEFNSAVQDSGGDLDKLFEALGITGGEVDTYKGKVSASSDVIRDNAQAFADTRTPIQNLQGDFERLTSGPLGDFVGIAGDLAPVFLIIGTSAPLIAGIGGSVLKIGSAAITALPSIIAMAAPFLVIAVVALLILGAVIGLNETFNRGVDAGHVWGQAVRDEMTRTGEKVDVTKEGFDRLNGLWQKGPIGIFEWISQVKGLGDELDANGDFFGTYKDKVLGALGTVGKFIELTVTSAKLILNSLSIGFHNMVDNVVGSINSLITRLTQPLRDFQNQISVLNPFAQHSPSLVEQVTDGVALIRARYAGLGDLSIGAPALAGFGAGAAGSGPGWSGPLVHIENYSGGEGEDQRLARLIERTVPRR